MLSRLIDPVMRRPGVIALALILVFAMAGTVYAASRGNAWRLGYVETLNSYNTGIVGARGGGEMFKIKNTAGASGSLAIRAENDSSSATIYLKNTGTGSAAEFVTGPGRAPFKVNQPTKVTNLNADRVDGLSASAFRMATLPVGATESGVWGLSGATDGNPLLTINYRSILSSPLPVANTHFFAEDVFSADCPAIGQAAAGHLCIYAEFNNGMTFSQVYNPEIDSGGSGRTGFTMYMTSTNDGANALGTWTVGAPAVLLDVSNQPTDSDTGQTAGR